MDWHVINYKEHRRMKVKFCGAAGTVTGSSHLLELDSGFKILLDCGLYQGKEEEFRRFNEGWLFDPGEIDCLVLSHSHIDHCGRIPKLYRDGFRGDIISTSATRDLAAIMLVDSAHIQEQDARYKSKKNYADVDPLYTIEDAEDCLELFVGISYNRWYKVNDEVSLMFRDAGHILGSASVTLKIMDQEGKETVFGFSGDIGRPDRPILKDPQIMPDLDYLICESTYGGKEHQGRPKDQESLKDIVDETCVKNKGKLIIPAFSVGRTQEIVYMLDQLETAGQLPPVEVFVDSPLAVNATEIFSMHPECYDRDLTRYTAIDSNPFGFKELKYIRSAEDSKKLNDYDKPCIIISASGMMQAGRIRHHLYNNIDNPRNTVLVVGYCSPGTTGAHIRSRPETVRIFGKNKQVRAQIKILDSFSAHADHSEILDFIRPLDKKKLKQVFLVHGAEERQLILKGALEDLGCQQVVMPHLGESFDLS